MKPFQIGDTVKCVSRRKFSRFDDIRYLAMDKIFPQDKLTVNSVEVNGIGFDGKDYLHDPRNFKLVRRAQKQRSSQ